jgi:hypothetical protein
MAVVCSRLELFELAAWWKMDGGEQNHQRVELGFVEDVML